MSTIVELKEQSATQTPLFLVTCELVTGAVERWSTHRVTVDGQAYEARILRHNLFEIRTDAEDGGGLSRVSFTLANADSRCSQIERGTGWKGAKVTVRFLFFNLKSNTPASESSVVFRGTADPPEETTETAMRLTVSNRMGLQRLLVPEIRIQRRCPWKFPATAEQRAEAASGGEKGKYSPFYRCGYSAGAPGGRGNQDAGVPYTTCDYTRAQCEQRGMFAQDAGGNPTRRFGGIEFVPSTILVRSHGEKSYHPSPLLENEGRYNDFVPIVYGTGWYAPPIVFARNDGNLTHLEILLGMGEIQGVLKVLVNGVEVPLGETGKDMSATGWHNIVSLGSRTGNFNPSFQDAEGRPAGDPYGSMAVLSVATPNRINDGRILPRVEVLLQGLKLDRYGAQGQCLGQEFTNNPAWVILDILRRIGYGIEEIDLASFAAAAACCAEMIPAQDLYGNPVEIPRFQCNLALRKRRSAAEVIRAVRNGCRLDLNVGKDGKLAVKVENSMAQENPVKPPGSNSTEELNGGWPCYEFGDGTQGFTGILRKENGEPAMRTLARGTADAPNRLSVEFQDEFNEYQQDSLSLVDVDDALRAGQEISAPLSVLGIPNFHQAARIIQWQLDKSLRGNTYVEFETSVRGVGLKPEDLITVTYLKEGLARQAFRIRSVAPGPNYRTVLITAQIHSDDWYTDELGAAAGFSSGRRRPGSETGLPRPLLGSVLDENGEPQFEITERLDEGDGQSRVWLTVNFLAPAKPSTGEGSVPLVDLAAVVSNTGGTLAGDQTLYYAVSAVTGGQESPLSFLVRATIPPGGDTNSIRLRRLAFAAGTTGFHVYRGTSPAQLLQIASDQPTAAEFLDNGLPNLSRTAPDENYDHANFYWRFELQPEEAASVRSATTIGNETLAMTPDSYRGMTVRITRGKGAGQERAVVSNTITTLTVAPAWLVEPDSTSAFVVAESSWRFGAMSSTSPAEFEVPARGGATVHVSGRSANVNDKECAYELSPLTRWRIGGGGAGLDGEPPGKPVFSLYAPGRGTVELLGIGFEDLANTRTVTAATLTLNYWDELLSPTGVSLADEAGEASGSLVLSTSGPAKEGDLIQVDAEIMTVTAVSEDRLRYTVERAQQGTLAARHSAGAGVYHLQKKIFAASIPKDFFGSPYSGRYAYSMSLSDVRIASAEMYVTNARGNSETTYAPLTQVQERGLRTLSGGQLSIQVEGYLAIQSDVAPPLVVEETHSVHDIQARVSQAPTGRSIEVQLRQDGEEYCTLTIPEDTNESDPASGFGAAPLREGARLSLDIVAVGSGFPGRNLTVTVRL